MFLFLLIPTSCYRLNHLSVFVRITEFNYYVVNESFKDDAINKNPSIITQMFSYHFVVHKFYVNNFISQISTVASYQSQHLFYFQQI